MKSVVLALCGVLLAPYQCGSKGTQRPVEDTAPKALWVLAERFEADNDAKARETTLRQLAEKYPSSRYAQKAREALGIPEPELKDHVQGDPYEPPPQEAEAPAEKPAKETPEENSGPGMPKLRDDVE